MTMVILEFLHVTWYSFCIRKLHRTYWNRKILGSDSQNTLTSGHFFLWNWKFFCRVRRQILPILKRLGVWGEGGLSFLGEKLLIENFDRQLCCEFQGRTVKVRFQISNVFRRYYRFNIRRSYHKLQKHAGISHVCCGTGARSVHCLGIATKITIRWLIPEQTLFHTERRNFCWKQIKKSGILVENGRILVENSSMLVENNKIS